MQDSDRILLAIKEKGYRFARVTQRDFGFARKSPHPLSSSAIRELLSKKKINANKTTIYRQLTFLKKQNLIRELQFGDNKKRYEIMPENHHHIICTDCGKIEGVELA